MILVSVWAWAVRVGENPLMCFLFTFLYTVQEDKGKALWPHIPTGDQNSQTGEGAPHPEGEIH